MDAYQPYVVSPPVSVEGGIPVSYIQQASIRTGPGGRTDALGPNAPKPVLFTNISNQQMYPGDLPNFFGRQGAAMQPMPFGAEDADAAIAVSASSAQGALQDFLSEGRNNGSQFPRKGVLADFFQGNAREAGADVRTRNQVIWGVPVDLAEARETDLF